MQLGKKRKLGRRIEELEVGETFELTEKMEDRDLLLYLGLTNDNNPLYIQHDYAAQTPFEKPIVPHAMLTGILTSAISKHLPGPGSYIKGQQLTFHAPVFHDDTIECSLRIEEIREEQREVNIHVLARLTDGTIVLEGEMAVNPPFTNEITDGSMKE
ncbi:MaoC/PaaZ C-terminal domain-containing protein [Planomicrobium sp. YIM 101495]|uniref:MaoC/PaaZ C-terminal domain-containing protein n=1 Tax=Planomicrobium sp. YIM 101495 TaxID=2665160 RepID=UPI0012B90401|nr:MaoC/PaaZ C-terminal domain-containing protein [Planomicrobium sp. YIM 101495]MTD29589.1 enoyl-CoA hydratase [Planomicrobium sp. YIM 101495]